MSRRELEFDDVALRACYFLCHKVQIFSTFLRTVKDTAGKESLSLSKKRYSGAVNDRKSRKVVYSVDSCGK